MGNLSGILNLFCACVIAVMFVAVTTFEGADKLAPTRTFRVQLILTFTMLVTDGVATLFFMDVPVVLRLLEALSFLSFYALYAAFAHYIVFVTDAHDRRTLTIRRVCVYACVLLGVIWTANSFVPFIYDVTQQAYVSTGAHLASTAANAVVLGLEVAILFLNMRKVDVQDVIAITLALLLPLTANLFTSIQPGMSVRYAGITLAMLINYVRVMLNAERRLAERNRTVEEYRVRSLLERMKPHYIYNVLASIYYLCDDDPKVAQKAVTIFSNYLRGVLEMMDKESLIPFEQELKTIKNYVDLEKMRFGDKFTFRYSIETTDFELPPFTVQPLVENAVKHGMKRSDGGGEILLETYEVPDGCYVNVYNNCTKEDASKRVGSGFGTKYIRDMLAVTGAGTLTVTSDTRGWTTASIFIKKDDKKE